MDVVFNLKNVKRFSKYSFEEKIELKAKGRPLPDIIIEKTGSSRGKSFTRKFNRDMYLKNEWICGCNKSNALYCFPCLLFGGDKAWREIGITDLEHLSMKLKRHESSKSHVHNCMEFAVLGSPNIRAQLDPSYWINVQRHNENVSKNRYILSKIINCIKFCGAFELALRGHDDSDSDTSDNPGIFRGLINFSAELDSTLSEHLKNSSIFKGTSNEIQNDLLQCMLEVCHEQIIEEIHNAPFLAIMADDISDVAAKSQLVVIFRYVRDGEPVERFWNYLIPERCDAETLSTTILTVIDHLLQNVPHKLIAQSYDGAAVMSDQHAGVQALIKKQYPFAHYVHCYAHQLNLIMSKAASANAQVRVFFGNLEDIPAFFNKSSQRVEVFNKIVNPPDATTPWNFNIETINVVYENRTSLIECMHKIEDQFSNNTVCSAAASIRRTLNDPIFNFWLTFFHYVMPHVDILFNQLQQRKVDNTLVRHAIDTFERGIIQVRNNIDNIISEAADSISDGSLENKLRRPCNSKFDHRISALEVCDVIVNCAKDRFHFNEHLIVASLFFSEYFGGYCGKFPADKLTAVCSSYPTLDKERLRTELSVIYSRHDCRALSGVLPLLKFLITNNLGDTLKETRKLLEIVVTTPMITSEAERCFSTLKRIKRFLRNSMTEDRLATLSMLSVEKKFISEIDNFNDKVITRFANRKERTINLIYKNMAPSQPPVQPRPSQKSVSVPIQPVVVHQQPLETPVADLVESEVDTDLKLEIVDEDLVKNEVLTDSFDNLMCKPLVEESIEELQDAPRIQESNQVPIVESIEEITAAGSKSSTEEQNIEYIKHLDDSDCDDSEIVELSRSSSDSDARLNRVTAPPSVQPSSPSTQHTTAEPKGNLISITSTNNMVLKYCALFNHKFMDDASINKEQLMLILNQLDVAVDSPMAQQCLRDSDSDKCLAQNFNYGSNLDLFFDNITKIVKTLSPRDQIILQEYVTDSVLKMRSKQSKMKNK